MILEPRLRPAARAAMLDCVLNLLVQPLITVRLGVLDVDVASTPPARAARRRHRRDVPLTQVAGSDRSSTDGVTDGGVSEAWMKDMTAKGEALGDNLLSQQLTWWCLDLAIWHHVPSRVQG